MSLLDRLEVPLAQSRASTIAVVRPRVTASRAEPAPTTPPPTTRTSTSSSAIRAIASSRAAGDSSAVEHSSATTRSVDLHPVERALYRLLPAGVAVRALLLIPFWLPAPGFVPVGLQFVGVGPESGGQARRVRGTERGRLRYDGSADRHAQDVGLQLHAQVVGGDAAVDLQHLQVHAGILLHGLADVAALVADRLQGCPGQVSVGVEPGQADDHAAGVASPVRREQPGERRNEIDPAVVGHLAGQRFGLGRTGDHAELVAQPLYRRSGDRDRALQGVAGLAVTELVADGRQEP